MGDYSRPVTWLVVLIWFSFVLDAAIRRDEYKKAMSELKQLRQAIAKYHTPLPAEQESE